MSNTIPFTSLPPTQLVQVIDLDDHFKSSPAKIKTSPPITKEQFIKETLTWEDGDEDEMKVHPFQEWVVLGEQNGPTVLLVTIINNIIHHII